MHKSTSIFTLLVCGFAAITGTVQSANTVGLITNAPSAWPGYTLFPPGFYTSSYLINDAGNLIHSWPSAYQPGQSAYLAENGHLYRSVMLQNSVFNIGGTGGGVQEFDWDGTLLWSYTYSTTLHCQHHDFEILPNGNVLMIAWEYKSQSDAVAAGRNPTLISAQGLWPDHVVEVQPSGTTNGTIVWEWHLWDHLVQDYSSGKANYGNVTNSPQLVDINYNARASDTDWIHCNAIHYNPTFNQILISAHNLSEVWVIDHSTTTTQAAGHTGGNSSKGGDLLYRWGNPAAYRRGTAADKKLFGQHDAQWIATNCPGAGNILVFNNGPGRTGGTNYSTVDELVPPVDASGNYALTAGSAYGPTNYFWTYKASPPTNFFGMDIGGVQRLPNGNSLITYGICGTLFEVTTNGTTVWDYVNPVTSAPLVQGSAIPTDPVALFQTQYLNEVFKVHRYDTNFVGLLGKDLTPRGTIEIYSNAVTDTYGLGLPDIWVRAKFGSLSAITAISDHDGDGVTDVLEFKYGTDPTLWSSANDGIPDGWAIANGFDPTLASSAMAMGNNGFTALQSYLAGLDPNNSASKLQISDISLLGANVRITWTGGTNAWQYLQYRTNFANTNAPWITLYTNVPPTTVTNQFIHQGGSGQTSIFYRIKAWR